jgi:hypothetical protein
MNRTNAFFSALNISARDNSAPLLCPEHLLQLILNPYSRLLLYELILLASQETLCRLQSSNVPCNVHKDLPLDPDLNYSNPVHAFCFIKAFSMVSKLRSCRRSFLWKCYDYNFMCLLCFPSVSSCVIWLPSKNVRWRVQIMTLVFMQLPFSIILLFQVPYI